MADEQKNKPRRSVLGAYMGMGTAIGAGVGASVGSATGNMGLWLGVGVALGVSARHSPRHDKRAALAGLSLGAWVIRASREEGVGLVVRGLDMCYEVTQAAKRPFPYRGGLLAAAHVVL